MSEHFQLKLYSNAGVMGLVDIINQHSGLCSYKDYNAKVETANAMQKGKEKTSSLYK